MRRTGSIVSLVLLACAGGPSYAAERLPLPTQPEVVEHITARWADWGQRFAASASRLDDTARLKTVRNVSCDYSDDVPLCWAEVTANFNDDSELTQSMFAQFARDEAGGLKEVVVFDRKPG